MAKLQERDELIDKVVDQSRRLMEKWNNRITLDNLRLGERYLEGNLDVVLHWEFVGRAGRANQFVAVFHHAQSASNLPSGNRVELIRWPLTADFDFGGTAQCGAPRHCHTYDQMAVLVENVKVVNQPQVIVPPTPSLVRFGFPNEFYGTRRESLYYSRELGFVFGSRFADRKLVLSAGIRLTDHGELPDQVVQGRPEVVYGIADDTGEVMRDFGPDFDPKDLLSRLRILLEASSITVGFTKGRELLFKLSDVVVGPFDFRPDGPQPV